MRAQVLSDLFDFRQLGFHVESERWMLGEFCEVSHRAGKFVTGRGVQDWLRALVG